MNKPLSHPETLHEPQVILLTIHIKDPEPKETTQYGHIRRIIPGQSIHTTRLQYSLHRPGRHLMREIALVFPGLASGNVDDDLQGLKGDFKDLIIITTFQQAVQDLIGITPETNWERIMLLEYV